MLDTITYTKLRDQLAKTLDKVTSDRAPILITRQKGKPAVLISMEDFSAMEEAYKVSGCLETSGTSPRPQGFDALRHILRVGLRDSTPHEVRRRSHVYLPSG